MSESAGSRRDPASERLAQRGAGESEPDVLLDVPEVTVDQIRLSVEGLDADLSLRARLANLLQLDAGVRVHLEGVELDVTGVSAEALLKVRLEKLAQILDRALTTLDRNPHLIEALARSIGGDIDDVNRAAQRLAGEPVVGASGQRIGTVGAVADRALREGVGQPTPPTPGAPTGARAPEPPTGDQGQAKPPSGAGGAGPSTGGGGRQPSGREGGGAETAGARREGGPSTGQGGGPSREGWQPGREGGLSSEGGQPRREGGPAGEGRRPGGEGGPSREGAGGPSTGRATTGPGKPGPGKTAEPGKPPAGGKPEGEEKGAGGPPGPVQLAGQAGETLLQAGRSVWEAIQSGMGQHRPKR
ncbi:hypothetical protein ABZV78_00485 [Micromonospora sp. NPDC004540]|uniref:hypothetical protein n=1 Tax=Micromonospora sp. NPDC004540 TaxID=3154457 RepID=UPI0033A2F048